MSNKRIAFYAADNRVKKDSSAVFAPGAKHFARLHEGTSLVGVNNGSLDFAGRRRVVTNVLLQHEGLDCVAFFCHGYKTGLQLWSNKSEERAAELGRLLRERMTADGSVAFYACSTGDDLVHGDDPVDGFAVTVSAHLYPTQRVLGHYGPGHAVVRPYIREFRAGRGQWIIPPSAGRWREWVAALRSTDLPYRLPFMNYAEVLRAVPDRKHAA